MSAAPGNFDIPDTSEPGGLRLETSQSVYVAGHTGMVGSAVVRALRRSGIENLVCATHGELDLTRQDAVEEFLGQHRPDVAIVAAARVGGILANSTSPAEFIYQNLAIAVNVVQAARSSGVRRLIYLGSTCAYPANAQQPTPEESLLGGPLEESNEAYAVAKIAGIKLCQFYRRQYGVLYHAVMPTNLYGPGDRYDDQSSHVIPALIGRIHDAKVQGDQQVRIWGTGNAFREFLHADDLAAAILRLMSLTDPPDLVNVGSGHEISIQSLAELIADVVGFHGKIVSDPSMPEGVPRKLADSSRMKALGWTPTVSLRQGIGECYRDFLGHQTQFHSEQ